MKYYRERTDVEKFGRLCVCGHYKHDHQGFLIWLLTFGKLDGKCWNCACPLYRPDRTLNQENKRID